MAWVPQASCFEHIGYGHLGLVPVVDELHPDKAVFTRRSLLEKLWAIEGLDEVDHAGIDGAPAVIVDLVEKGGYDSQSFANADERQRDPEGQNVAPDVAD